jgi:hypothetical protein
MNLPPFIQRAFDFEGPICPNYVPLHVCHLIADWLEHRFYGQSQFTPQATGPSTTELPYLTHEQVKAW